jgi:hypothetical protein
MPSDKASHEAYPVGLQKPSHKASLRGNNIIIVPELTAAIDSGAAAAIEQADEIDAVACEVVDAILELAARVDPTIRTSGRGALPGALPAALWVPSRAAQRSRARH